MPQRKGDPVVVDTDEGVRPGTTVDSLGKLRPAFDKAGNITAGNASQISDGAAAVIVTSKAKAEELGLDTLGAVKDWAADLGMGPAKAAATADSASCNRPSSSRREIRKVDAHQSAAGSASISASRDTASISWSKVWRSQ